MKKIEITVNSELIEADDGQTVMDAMIAAGINVIGHIGCKGGVCGACACLVKRTDGKVKASLACRTVAEDKMTVLFPESKAIPVKYDFDKLTTCGKQIAELYPEIYNCVNCGKCTENCVRGIDVRKMIENAKYGDLEKIAEMSFDCIACGACSFNCPAKINHAEVGLLARRLQVKTITQS